MSPSSILIEQIAAVQKTLDDLNLRLAAEEAKTPLMRIAEELHSLTCAWDHTSGCGWFYEITKESVNWDGNAHGSYLAKARKLFSFCETKNISVRNVLDGYAIVKEI